MYQDHSALQAAGQLLLAFAFLASGVRNLGWMFRQHEERMRALGVPWARGVLIVGFVLQFGGAALLALDYRRALGAWLLVLFTLAASAIFHRWWRIQDPLLRHLHIGNLLVNAGVVGGLLLVAAL
ncbi:MAG TPA: DoxX family protein [Burkholderiales bacterium]|nr:DoxX family protein [Burkholderiales bacterium]